MTNGEARLGNYFSSRREKGVAGLPTLSVTLDRGLVRRDSLERRTDTKLAPEEHLRVRPGDIAYNMMRMWQGASGLATEDALVSPAYVVLAPKANVDPKFAAYLLKLPHMVHLLWAYSYGLTNDRLRLYFNDFKRIPWELPPLPEQKKIAEILSTWDKAIETTEKLLANAEAQKKALMQQLLTGKRRLKGVEGEWKEGRLGAGIKLISGQHIDAADVNEERDGHPYLTGPADFPNGEISCTKYTKSPKVVCAMGDILVTVKGSGTGKTIVADRSYAISRQLMAVRPVDFVPGWVQSILCSDESFHRQAAAGLIPGISRSDILNRAIRIPTTKEQEAIADVLYSADNIVASHKATLSGMRLEKRALMQQLLTGRRRVSV